jgi:site-specific recombinase XerC
VKQLLEDHWLASQRTRGLKDTTLAHYEVTAARYLIPLIGARKVATLTPNDIALLVQHLRTVKSASGKDSLSARTAQMTVGTLKSATAWALQNGLIARDPLAGVKRPSVGRRPMSIWTEEEARTFLNSVRGDRLEVA